MTALVLASIPACKKKNEKPAEQPAGSAVAEAPVAAPAGSAAPAATGSAVAAAPSGDACPPGAYKPKSGAFCIDAQGFKPGDESANGSFVSMAFEGSADNYSPEVDINWDTNASATDYNDRLKVIEDNAKLPGVKLEEEGDMPGGTGKWVISSHQGYKEFNSITKGTKANFNCQGNAAKDAPVSPAILAICKSLHPLI